MFLVEILISTSTELTLNDNIIDDRQKDKLEIEKSNVAIKKRSAI